MRRLIHRLFQRSESVPFPDAYTFVNGRFVNYWTREPV
jgi:hypothetical protein